MSVFEDVKAKYDTDALDTMSALYWRGALDSGSIPSDAGLAQLRKDGLAETNWDEENAHRLTELGKAFAKTYFDSKAEVISEVADRSSFVLGEVYGLLESTALRWMSADVKSDEFRTKCGDALEFECVDIENNPAYTRKTYRSLTTIEGLKAQVILTIDDRTTDVEAKFVYVA